MKWWMEAYWSGLGAKEAQIQVKNFSSRCYTSHRRIPESVATQFDTYITILGHGGRIRRPKKNNSPSFEYFDNWSSSFVPMIERSISTKGIRISVLCQSGILLVQK